MKVDVIDHMHINVRDLDKAVRLFTALTGHEYPEPLVIEEVKMRIAWNRPGIEIAEPVSPDSPVAKTIDERGEGIIALSLRINDIESRVRDAEALGLRVVSRIGAEFELQAQLHPKESFGVMVELVEILEGFPERPMDAFHQSVDHIHIYVRNLEKAIELFSALTDTEFSTPVIIDEIKARTASNALGIVLTQPTDQVSPIARVIEKRGEGFRAIAFKVTSLEDGISNAEASGLKLVSQNSCDGRGRQAQFDPEDAFGVVVELVERPQK